MEEKNSRVTRISSEIVVAVQWTYGELIAKKWNPAARRNKWWLPGTSICDLIEENHDEQDESHRYMCSMFYVLIPWWPIYTYFKNKQISRPEFQNMWATMSMPYNQNMELRLAAEAVYKRNNTSRFLVYVPWSKFR